MRHGDNQQVMVCWSWLAGSIDGDGCVYAGVMNRSKGRRYINPSVFFDNRDEDFLNHYLYSVRTLGVNPHIRKSRDMLRISISKKAHLLKVLPVLAQYCRGIKAEKAKDLYTILSAKEVDFDLVDLMRKRRVSSSALQMIEVDAIPSIPPDPVSLGWLGGLLDAEGNVFLGRYTKPSGQKYWAYSCSFANQDPGIIRSGIGIIKGMGILPQCRILGRRVKGRTPVYSVGLQDQEQIMLFFEHLVSYLKSNKRKQAVSLCRFLRDKSETNFRQYKSTRTSTTLREAPIILGVKIESEHLSDQVINNN